MTWQWRAWSLICHYWQTLNTTPCYRGLPALHTSRANNIHRHQAAETDRYCPALPTYWPIWLHTSWWRRPGVWSVFEPKFNLVREQDSQSSMPSQHPGQRPRHYHTSDIASVIQICHRSILGWKEIYTFQSRQGKAMTFRGTLRTLSECYRNRCVLNSRP